MWQAALEPEEESDENETTEDAEEQSVEERAVKEEDVKQEDVEQEDVKEEVKVAVQFKEEPVERDDWWGHEALDMLIEQANKSVRDYEAECRNNGA